jgi:hypothetical protein
MAQFYTSFIKKIVAIMAPKMTRKTKTYFWIEECLKVWELINIYIYIEASMLVGGVSCSYRCILVSCRGHVVLECNNIDQLVMYVSRLLNRA